MENGKSLFATFSEIDPGFAIVEFNTADLLVLLSLERLEARYARHFGLAAENGRSATVASPPRVAVA